MDTGIHTRVIHSCVHAYILMHAVRFDSFVRMITCALYSLRVKSDGPQAVASLRLILWIISQCFVQARDFINNVCNNV